MIYGRHFLQKKAAENDGYVNEDGDYIANESGWCNDHILCDIVAENGRMSATHYADGIERAYSYVITLESDCPDFKIGEQILITNSTVSEEKTVVGFQRYGIIAKIWA